MRGRGDAQHHTQAALVRRVDDVVESAPIHLALFEFKDAPLQLLFYPARVEAIGQINRQFGIANQAVDLHAVPEVEFVL